VHSFNILLRGTRKTTKPYQEGRSYGGIGAGVPLTHELNVTAILSRSERSQVISNTIYLMDAHFDYAADMNVTLFAEQTE
jgi:hypothetical protein